MDIRLSPPREGARGGREQFKWDDVKSYATKEREHYLGHSVKIGMLKHKNKFYKHDWYLNQDGTNRVDDASDELHLIKLYENELMEEMLGSKPKRLMLLKSRPSDCDSLRKLLSLGDETRPSTEGCGTNTNEHQASDADKRHCNPTDSTDFSRVNPKIHRRSRDRSRSRGRDSHFHRRPKKDIDRPTRYKRRSKEHRRRSRSR
ncbi:kinase phosphorylation protein [Babesia caballi]|uniref:Kinase phosphorylation protein n=1 Tax=Babesia caballi TaxID=5871 RepID=A0AAV4LNT1_BABCB|nr:kinase phosphorylation protein [Babesia caballi]